MKIKNRFIVIFFAWVIIFSFFLIVKYLPAANIDLKNNQADFHSEYVGKDNLNALEEKELKIDVDANAISISSMNSFENVTEINNIDNIQ